MKCEIIIDENTVEEKIVIYAKRDSEKIREIKSFIDESDLELIGFMDDQIIKLDATDVFCFTIVSGKIYAVLEKEKVLLKTRLYSLEENLSNTFIKINQSCLVNIKKIDRFDASITGTLKVILKNGYSDYVARRQVKNIKKRMRLIK